MLKLLFLLFSGVKLGKLALTGGSMLLSVVLYAVVYGWKYAVGFVLLMFVHELGHYLAAHQRGLGASLPMFVPFLGAWTELDKMPHDAETEAFVGLGGPLLGTVGALACYFFARNAGGGEDITWLLAVSYGGFFLNLFNMIPMLPFDGGRITAVLGPRIWLVGAPVFGFLLWRNPSPMMFIVALMAAPQLWKALTWKKDSEEARTYYAVSNKVRIEYGAYYLVLLAFLAMMTQDVHEMLQALHGARGAV